ncbi:hypothetical protein [Cytobacillus oceanisediminis]|nr:hypothetical protein [Cytobacillus oceanisediminis]MCM3241822.1 hypothetical protein [Cytobacillus oceanisediminis]MCM3404070.1 hypothetical protein [Cytobacillus oceanisediminis]MDK7666621.1 hypothetical protein [Cytobacillus oceanisediminis]
MNKDEYITVLEKRVEEYEAAIADMTAPIIPSIIPQTILAYYRPAHGRTI